MTSPETTPNEMTPADMTPEIKATLGWKKKSCSAADNDFPP